MLRAAILESAPASVDACFRQAFRLTPVQEASLQDGEWTDHDDGTLVLQMV
jgi:hypothetical protein